MKVLYLIFNVDDSRHILYKVIYTLISGTNLMLNISQFTHTWNLFSLISLVFKIVWFVSAYFYLSQLNRALLQINCSDII